VLFYRLFRILSAKLTADPVASFLAAVVFLLEVPPASHTPAHESAITAAPFRA